MQVEEVIEVRCLTRLHRERITFNWTISDFPFVKTSTLCSSVFPESGPENVGRWRLWLTPAYRSDSVHDISLQQVGTTNITANVKISLINSAGFLPKSEMRHGYLFCANGGNVQLPKFVQYDNDRDESKGVLNTDKLTIACEISVDIWWQHKEELVPVEGPLSKLDEDMGNLLSSESLTDVTIEAGGRQFKAHKAILAARSPVFAAMFRNEMVENKISVVTIPDIDPDVFGQVLEHIYTGKEISHNESSINELLAAAEKYNLKGLKRSCERKLCEKLSVENVLENLALADLHNAVELKRKALWLLANNRSQVMKSSRWDEFASSHKHVLKEICEIFYC